MSDQLTRMDSLREYLTGATSDGAGQINPSAALGNYRSGSEAICLGMQIDNAIPGTIIPYVSGANGPGVGMLTVTSNNSLCWTAPGDNAPGPSVAFGINDPKVLESGSGASKYIRVVGTSPFSVGASSISLTRIVNNVFGMDTVSIANATSGNNEYRATIIRNESGNLISDLRRWIGLLGTQQVSDTAHLGSSGSGSIATSGTLVDWPETGWVQVRSSGGTLKEVVYYTSRTSLTLTVPAVGRGLLGTTATAGSGTDVVYPVPGVAIGFDSAGVQSFGSSIQIVASANVAPIGITWSKEITQTGALQLANLGVGKQIGFWIWKHIPAGCIANPLAEVNIRESFNAW